MKVVVVVMMLCIAVAAVVASRPRWYEVSKEYTFEQYKRDFGKTYASAEEEAVREKLFLEEREYVLRFNGEDRAWKVGINRFSDRTPAERRVPLGYKKSLGFLQVENRRPSQVFQNNQTYPPSFDWTGEGILTAVKDQSNCGSCWSFAAAEGIESAWAIKTGELPVLSEQQILSCTANPDHCGGSGGCGGGTVNLAYDQIIAMGGITSEWRYPYLSAFGNDSPCVFRDGAMELGAVITGYEALPSNLNAPLLNALATVGPIPVSVDASEWSRYETGIFNGCNQDNPDLNHAVLLVGYGHDPKLGQSYYKIRNSWSPTWGEDGYIRIFRDDENIPCGVDTQPQDGTACDGGPSSVTACGTCGVLYDSVYPTV